MIYVGIDVAKDKHDCFAINSDGEILIQNLTFKNNSEGFHLFFNSISNFNESFENIKVGLEATGHYSNNILNFLTSKGFNVFVINPLQTNLFRKGQSLRITKTDKLDARFIATMLISNNLKPYSNLSYHISELKSLVRHRFRLIEERSKFKVSLSRLITIIFPELEKIVWSISQNSVLYLLTELPSVKDISECNLRHLTNILEKYSKGKYSRDKALEIRELAKKSIGTCSHSLSFELKQVIQTILFLQSQIDDIDKELKALIEELNSPLMTIPGISYVTVAYILAEIGDIDNFDSPSKLQAFAGLDPSTYQSGKFIANHASMVKRASKYLRWALLTATRLVCMRDKNFNDYKNKKLAEGKHYFVALSHTSKKLIRVIYYLLKTNKSYHLQKVA
ncbi:IS110 family transposase [Lactobacillus taiwanensis]|uniref:IS110 family transposase n=1 Tax=Lactobacillus taiwanensis TaxID=508451 RepID=UPI0025A5B2BD|nr:IS110 family transposase [Lactobacillus taiwanensis]